MGSQDLFHRRKARAKHQLKRKNGMRAPYKKILIVCEGEKTEPNYFFDARKYYELNSVNVEVTGLGQDPKGLLVFAKQRYEQEKRRGDAYDAVYCVFDKDTHSSYDNVIKEFKRMNLEEVVWFAINSVPSFEFWLLLHFTYTTRPFVATGNLSSGDLVLSELKTYMPNYEKNMKGLFTELIDSVGNAKNSAENILRECERNNTDNPSTKVHILVNEIQNLKN